MTRTTPVRPRDQRVDDALRVTGSATVFRLYDIGYEISLDKAAVLLGDATRGRMSPTRDEARAIEIRNPPLVASLGDYQLAVDGQARTATLEAHFFEFGVCSLQLRLAVDPGVTWDEFAEFGERVESARTIREALDREVAKLLGRLAPAIERPGLAAVSEEYIVFRVDHLEAGGKPVDAAATLTDAQLIRLLLREQRPLSADAVRELVPHRFSYYADDLTVLTWDNALVVEPRQDDRDVEFVLEFANAQLLELRMFDSQLAASLPELYDRIAAARARRRPHLSGRFRTVLSSLQARVADITETIERVENALKVTNDVYLARIYAAALDLFRERAWRRGIDRKLQILRETYAMLNTEAQAARAELLEAAILALIVMEIVIALVRSGGG